MLNLLKYSLLDRPTDGGWEGGVKTVQWPSGSVDRPPFSQSRHQLRLLGLHRQLLYTGVNSFRCDR